MGDSSTVITPSLPTLLNASAIRSPILASCAEIRTRELRDVLAQAVRVPAGYVWGEDLLASFRERFRDATGTDTDAFPDDWPETRAGSSGFRPGH